MSLKHIDNDDKFNYFIVKHVKLIDNESFKALVIEFSRQSHGALKCTNEDITLSPRVMEFLWNLTQFKSDGIKPKSAKLKVLFQRLNKELDYQRELSKLKQDNLGPNGKIECCLNSVKCELTGNECLITKLDNQLII